MRQATKTIYLLAALLCAALLGFAVACDNGSDPATDTWTTVSSLNGLEGTWKGTTSVTEEGGTIDYTVTIKYDGTNVTQTIAMLDEEYTDTIPKADFTDAIKDGYIKLQVNQDKSKIKYIVYDSDDSSTEVILTKQ